MELDPMRVRYYGITEECLECQHCGRSDLKKTVMLHIIDADGNASELTYFGTTCAAKALGSTAAAVKKAAERAQAYRIARAKELEKILHSSPKYLENCLKVEWSINVNRHGGLFVDGVWFGRTVEGRGREEFLTAQETSWRKELEYCR